MTHDLLHGDLSAAVVDNVFLLVGLPLLALWTPYRVRSGRRPFTPAVVAVIAGLALVWTVVRNLPGFPLVPTMISSLVTLPNYAQARDPARQDRMAPRPRNR